MVSFDEPGAKGELLSRWDVLNEPRNVAMFLVRLLRGERVGAVGRQFGVGKYSSASSAMEKMKKKYLRTVN